MCWRLYYETPLIRHRLGPAKIVQLPGLEIDQKHDEKNEVARVYNTRFIFILLILSITNLKSIRVLVGVHHAFVSHDLISIRTESVIELSWKIY